MFTFLAELVNALVMFYPLLYFVIVPGFSDNVSWYSSPIQYPQFVVYPVCVVVVSCQAEISEIESLKVPGFQMEAYYIVCIFSKLTFYNGTQ